MFNPNKSKLVKLDKPLSIGGRRTTRRKNSFIKKNAKPRISIDFGINISDNLDIISKKNKRWQYLSLKEFQKDEKCKFLNFNKSIHSTSF